MKKLLQIVLVSSLSLLCFSCYYDEMPEEIIVEIPDTQTVSFSSEIQPILSKCTNCHNANMTLNLTEGNSYNSLVPNFVTANNADGSRLYTYLPGNGHHDVGFTLSNTEIALVKAWINQGALNN